METWRKIWRVASLSLSTKALEALRDGLQTDDIRLAQGITTSPPPIQCCEDEEVEMACPIAYAIWRGDDLTTVKEVEAKFAELCAQTNSVFEYPGFVSILLNYIDETPRITMRNELLKEVNLSLETCSQNPEAA